MPSCYCCCCCRYYSALRKNLEISAACQAVEEELALLEAQLLAAAGSDQQGQAADGSKPAGAEATANGMPGTAQLGEGGEAAGGGPDDMEQG